MDSDSKESLSSDRPAGGSSPEHKDAPSKVESSDLNVNGNNETTLLELPDDMFTGKVFPTYDEAFTALKKAAHEHGFSVKKKKTNRSKRARSAGPDEVWLPVTHYLVCARAGKSDSRLGPGVKPKRNRPSALTNCKWRATIKNDAPENTGYFTVAFAGGHNHPPALDLRSLPIARRMTKEQVEKSKRLLRSGLKPASVLDVIKSDLGNDVCLVIEKDIANIQQHVRRGCYRRNYKSPVTSHILDTSLGRPAANVRVELQMFRDNAWVRVNEGKTNTDGRVAGHLVPEASAFEAGTYSLVFYTAEYFEANGITEFFYPQVTVTFIVKDVTQDYHVPLLLNPFGYSTYRGS